MKTNLLLLSLTLLSGVLYSQDLVTENKGAGSFPLVTASTATAIYVDEQDHWLVQRAATLLQQDIEAVTGRRVEILHTLPASAQNLVIIGSLDHSSLIGKLAGEKKIPIDSLKGKWEAFSLRIVKEPLKGIDHALVIAGSDRRGTAYGIFELSQQIGVSPWYWWADVPVKKKKEIWLTENARKESAPVVKYRGFFINDEAPAFSGWTKEKFGGVNHLVYEKIFELLLRMKANYLWPAMWGNAFNDDDTLNPILADKYGIVMGTSHHEPMLRAQQEWKRYGSGPWNYETNRTILDSFWRKGIQHMGSHESIVTIGMRGDGDKPMTEGSNTELLERIVHDQRAILEEITGKPASATPQLWALYKEVQDYYDKGMRVPDDVTLLLCDDNWGNIRKLPAPDASPRPGGYGIYYHFDYVGGPRNYKWLNTNPIARVWEQMHLALEYGVDKIWIVNIGDIKPLEFPTEFFLDYAWEPGRWTADRLDAYSLQWSTRQFGSAHAAAIAEILTTYSFYNGRRKPELLSPDTYSLLNYQEAERITEDYNRLARQADSIYRLLPADYRDAYYQLILFPVKACANLNELYTTAARNKLYAAQGRSATDSLAARVRTLYTQDSLLSHYYNTILSNGKWSHMMDQTHIGYTYWQQPRTNTMPAVNTLQLPTAAEMGVSLEGSSDWWPNEKGPATLPTFSSYGKPHYIELFNRGQTPFSYSIGHTPSWLIFSDRKGIIDKERRIWVRVNWRKAPEGRQMVRIPISGPGGAQVVVEAIIDHPAWPDGRRPLGFAEANGTISIEAEHYNTYTLDADRHWLRIPHLGRTLSGMEGNPVNAPVQTPGGNSPRLDYTLALTDTGEVKVEAWFSPALDFNGKPLRYGISFDDEAPVIVDLTSGNTARGAWDKMVGDQLKIGVSAHRITHAGQHVLHYWMVDPAVVLQKIVVDAGGVRPSYLGPPESRWLRTPSPPHGLDKKHRKP